ESVRMGATFFSEGAFRSTGLMVKDHLYSLRQRLDVPYYQLLPKNKRNPKGDYALTPARDNRFWSKMDFPNRQMGNIVSLDQNVTISENGGKFELHFDVSGATGVPVALELAFRPGGKLEGSIQESTRTREKALILKAGIGRYRVGNDAIEFGPGQAEHEFLNLAGPSYVAHGGTLKANGLTVYITGFTPFNRVLTIMG